ncbi:MAG: hypothetical protein JST85_09740 [Acidobacteria bacterium]|nr:hypothetical protein [Acidobacteriota bacterium]
MPLPSKQGILEVDCRWNRGKVPLPECEIIEEGLINVKLLLPLISSLFKKPFTARHFSNKNTESLALEILNHFSSANNNQFLERQRSFRCSKQPWQKALS